MTTSLRVAVAAALASLAFSASAFDSGSSYSGSYSGWDSSRGCASGTDTSRRNSTLQVVGLTADGRLICFNESNPGDARDIGSVSLSGKPAATGAPDTTLVGIDFRVQDGKLYGVGNQGGVYVIDTSNASATFVNQLSVALSGTSFGVDFNPAADRLRITSDTGQNLRHNVNAGGTTIADATLNYTPGTPALGIGGSAYTNNDLAPATATTLYALDTALDQIAIQSPPNAGSLAATGKLGLDVQLTSGFDIYSTIRNGVTVAVRSLASLTVDGSSALYSVSLPTGAATARGGFGTRNQVIDIAIPLNQL